MSLAELVMLLPTEELIKLSMAIADEVQARNEKSAMQAAVKAADAVADAAEATALKT